MNEILNTNEDAFVFEGLGPLSLRVDNPKGDWLENKKRHSEEDGRRVSGAFNRMGAPTAYWSRNVFLPVSVLKGITGLNDEQNNVRDRSLTWLLDYMGRTNELPKSGDEEYCPMVVVDQDGKAWINEGNHRIMAAAKLGWQALPVFMQYYNGGEDVAGDLTPEKVKLFDRVLLSQGFDYKKYKL